MIQRLTLLSMALLSLAFFSHTAQGKLLFATHTRPPLSLYLTDVIQAALKPYSIEAQVEEMAGSRIILLVNSGQIDGDLSRVANFHEVNNHDSQNYLIVKEPVALTHLVVVSLKSKKLPQPLNWHSINQGLPRIAYLRGSKTIRKHTLEQNRVPIASNQQILEMLLKERVDYAIMFESVATNLLAQSEFTQQLSIYSPPLSSFNLYIYLNKKHADLVPLLELSLKQLKSSGFMQERAEFHQVDVVK
ncbi:substrate-binding periplasmic protein [Paraglaciecola aestuariivivens]